MNMRCGLLVCVAAACILGETVTAQDSQSLGEVARQQRLQKEKAASDPGKDAAGSKVVTNEEIPEHEIESNPKHGKGEQVRSQSAPGPKQSAEFWKSRIQAQKGQIASLQRRMDAMNSSIRFTSFDCGAKCEARNESQRNKQVQVELMQSQLEEQKKQLEQMQEAARRQGYGSSVYEP